MNENQLKTRTMKKPTICILDDDQFYAELLNAHLEFDGFHSKLFSNENNCIEHIKNHPPDILILDHKLEFTTGLELLETIGGKLKNTAVIYISAQDHYHVTIKALRLGAVDYIEKGEKSVMQLKRVIMKIKKHSHGFKLPVNINDYRLDTAFKAS